MEKKSKNTKALVSLCLAIAAAALLVLACIPMKELKILGKGTDIMLSGGINVIFCLAGFITGIAALVVGIMAKRAGKDSKAAFGKILGIICIISSLFIGVSVSAIALVNDFANDPENSILGKSVKDAEGRKQLQDIVDQLAHRKKG